jgi:hypothetical protein
MLPVPLISLEASGPDPCFAARIRKFVIPSGGLEIDNVVSST